MTATADWRDDPLFADGQRPRPAEEENAAPAALPPTIDAAVESVVGCRVILYALGNPHVGLLVDANAAVAALVVDDDVTYVRVADVEAVHVLPEPREEAPRG